MSNPLTDLFGKFFAEKTPSVLGIDVGASSIKIVQLKRKKGKAILETYGELALGPYAGIEIGRATNLPAEKIAEAIVDVLKEANATTTSCGISIPMRSSMVSLIHIPTTNRKQIDQMVPIEARKYIPVPIAEVSLSWSVIPTEKDLPADDMSPVKTNDRETTEVLMVAVHNDVVSNYQTIAKTSSLNVGFFEIEMFSAIRAVIDQGEVAPVMVLDMGAATTKLYIVERGIIRESHMINRGSQDITLAVSTSLNISIDVAERMKRNLGKNNEKEDKEINEVASLILESIFSEANNVLLNFQKMNNKNVVKVILTGGGSVLYDFQKKSMLYFQTQTVLSQPFNKTQAPAFLEEVLKVTGAEFSVAIGLALRKLQESE